MISGASAYMPIYRIGTKDAVDMMVDKYDLDKSGDLNIDEAQTVPILSRVNFKAADSFGDGKLTNEEFVAYVETMKLEMGQATTVNPLALMLSGEGIDEDTFTNIVSDLDKLESRKTFINYMSHLADEYATAQKEAGGGVDTKA